MRSSRIPAAQPLADEDKRKKDKDTSSSGSNSKSAIGDKKSRMKSSSASTRSGVPANFISEAEDPEDMEIARLEKLLGVTSTGKY